MEILIFEDNQNLHVCKQQTLYTALANWFKRLLLKAYFIVIVVTEIEILLSKMILANLKINRKFY